MKLSSRAHDLYEAFSRPGCPVCRLTLDSVHHHLDSLIYEYVNKPATHEAVRAARGFCPAHAWHVQDAINASAWGSRCCTRGCHGTCWGYGHGSSRAAGGGRSARRRGALKPRGPCPSCEHQRASRSTCCATCWRIWARRSSQRSSRESAGQCLPHLRQMLEQKGTPSTRRRLWRSSRRSGHAPGAARRIQCASTTTASPPIGKGEEGSSPRRANRGARRAEGLR